MGQQYGILNYKGNIVDSFNKGEILGYDELYRPYEVVDTEYDEETDKTIVYLQYATQESLKAHATEYDERSEEMRVSLQSLHAAGLTQAYL